MNQDDTFLLESKLKRLKISFSKENGRIIISKAKRDYVFLLGLIFFPLFFGICGVIYLIFGDSEYLISNSFKVVLLIASLVILGVMNIFRLLIKIKANKSTKILAYKELILKDKDTSQRFDRYSIHEFFYTVKEVEEELYHGKLFLRDTQKKEHLLLSFDSETEQYAMNDLQWFVDYLSRHVELPN